MRRALLALAALPLLVAAPARATGMQGHVYMAMCAAEQLPDGRLKALLAEHEMRLINGGFFPDSGYTNSADHDQGEVAHWEGFVESWIATVRATHPDPWSDPDGRKRIAQLMGLAAHGITDSTFDTLIFDRSLQVDPGGPDSLDMSMDVFLVADLHRELLPELDHDAAFASLAFDGAKHPVPQKSVEKAMSTARSGMAAVVKVLAPAVGDFAPKYPWARKAILDSRVPGSYPFGARVTLGYYRELEKRIDGDVGADGVVIGTYPSDELPLAGLAHDRADARLVVFFGHGIDRKSLAADTVVVTDASGAPVPVKVEPFRGDEWVNALTVTPKADWAADTTYTMTVQNTLKTLHGASPSAPYVVTFSTHCATTPSDPACVTSKPSVSLCPKNDARFQPVPEPEETGTGGAAGAGGAAPQAGSSSSAAPAAASEDDGGCRAAGRPNAPVAFGLAAAAALLVARRRRGPAKRPFAKPERQLAFAAMKLARALVLLPFVTSLGASVIGCDSEPETPTPRGSAKFTSSSGSFKEPDGTMKLCQFQASYKLGDPSAGSNGTIPNGDANIVQCTVKPAGAGFAFDVRITGVDVGANRSVEFSATGNTGADGKSTDVGAHFTIDSIPYYTGTIKCTVNVAPTSNEPWLQVAGGRIAASIECERLDANDNSGVCKLTGGYFSFENCAQ